MSLGDMLTQSDIPVESLAGLVFMASVFAGTALCYTASTAATYFRSLNYWGNENHQHDGIAPVNPFIACKR
jgi:hypothetical protein